MATGVSTYDFPEDISLLQRLLFLLDRTRHRVIVNLKKISAIDTSGLDTLVFSAMRFQECGGRLVLLRLGQSALPRTS